jgi:hypothetical protein
MKCEAGLNPKGSHIHREKQWRRNHFKNGANPKNLTSRKDFYNRLNMKIKNRLFMLMLMCASVMFVSCKKDNDDKKDEQKTVTRDNISAKWKISEANSKYVSFEFNKDGNYIVAERNGSGHTAVTKDIVNGVADEASANFLVFAKKSTKASQTNDIITHFGNFTIQDERTLILSGFGRLAVISMMGDELTFTLTPDGQTQATEYNATKVKNAVDASSSKTNLLCRTWKLVKLLEIPVPPGSDSELTMLISQAGTYFCKYADGSADLSQWKWYDYPGMEKESVIAYSHNEWASSSVAVIDVLTENTLILTDAVGILYEFGIDGK